MRKIWVPALAIASASLGYFAPHIPEQLTLIKFRDRAPASVVPVSATARSVQHVVVTEAAPPPIERPTETFSGNQHRTELERELNEIDLSRCQTMDDMAVLTCARLIDRLLWDPASMDDARNAAMALWSKCEDGDPVACRWATSQFDRMSEPERAIETSHRGCTLGTTDQCYSAIWSMALQKSSKEEIWAFAQASCAANDTTYCDVVQRPYSPANFEMLRETSTDYGAILLPFNFSN